MPQSVLDRTAEHIAESARKAARASSAVADAIADGVEAARRMAKQGGDATQEFMDGATGRLQRRPIETVVTTFAIGVAAGMLIGLLMRRKPLYTVPNRGNLALS